MPRRLALPLVAVLVALGVGGVLLFAGGKDTVPLSTVANAAEATNEAGGFKLTIDGSYEVPGAGQALPMKGSGALDPQRRRGHLLFDSAGALGGGGKIEQIFEGEVIYMRTPAAAQQLGAKKPWLRVNVKEAGQALGIDPGRLGQLGGNDPRQMIDQIRSVGGDVEKLGSEDVRGVATTKYRAEVDIRRYPDRLPPEQREQARVAVEKLVQQTGNDSYPMTLWIGGDDLVRRVRIEYDFDLPGQEKKGEFSMTMEFFDFGAPVDVAPPPARDVQDLTELAGGAGQGGSN
ncbi:MAG TPA: hypothetical protein VF712_11020 [Thermoleophilaceae bacterium]